ncbi:hypothetical protein B0H13DRAFT_2375458 [Mycena leptocephala]|nr:hypothetical protein B0H13DRAFT_2375458 [Mycena leptocephala]
MANVSHTPFKRLESTPTALARSATMRFSEYDAGDVDMDGDNSAAEEAYEDEDDRGGLVSDHSDDEEEEPAPRGRTRRVSEKEAQRRVSYNSVVVLLNIPFMHSGNEKDEAEARKVAKAAKAARKQQQREMEPEPLEDTLFVFREVAVPIKKAKTLQQRNSRVPVTQARLGVIDNSPDPRRGRTHEPSQDLRDIPIAQAALIPDLPALSAVGVGLHPVASATGASLPLRRLWKSTRSRLAHDPLTATSSPLTSKSTFAMLPLPSMHNVPTSTITSLTNDPRSAIVALTRVPAAAHPVHQPQATNEHDPLTMTCELLKPRKPVTIKVVHGPKTLTTPLRVNRHPGSDLNAPTPDIAKLIAHRGPQMRGELKTKVRALTELVFGFESGQNKRNVRKNRQLAEDLKEGMGYCYKESPADVEGRKGIYKAKIIQKAINQMWFNNRRDEGPIFPKPAFALVLSAIECSIDEWATGIKTDVPFTSADYRSVYQEHLKCLNEFEKHTAPRDILGNILTRVHNIGRFHSGAQPIAPVASTSALLKAALDAAIREYDEDENMARMTVYILYLLFEVLFSYE